MEEFVASTIRLSVPIALASVASLFAVRAGIFHLGIEGLMLAGAFTAVGIAHQTGSVILAIIGTLATSAVLSWIYWLLMEKLGADAVIAGLGLTGFSFGATAFFLNVIFDQRGRLGSPVRLPRPVSGPQEGLADCLNELSILGWLTPLFLLLSWFLMRRSQFGLRLTAVGTYSYGARAAGVNEGRIRLQGILLTSVGAALAGTELALGGLSTFSEGMTNGRGFIALAAALFGMLHPIGTAAAAVFFGAAEAVGVVTQVQGITFLPRPFILTIPFLLTILVVTVGAVVRSRSHTLRTKEVNVGQP